MAENRFMKKAQTQGDITPGEETKINPEQINYVNEDDNDGDTQNTAEQTEVQNTSVEEDHVEQTDASNESEVGNPDKDYHTAEVTGKGEGVFTGDKKQQPHELSNSSGRRFGKISEVPTETVLSLPASDLQKLFKKNNIMPVPVHGITISIDLDEFARLSEANPRTSSTINALTATLEETLTLEDVLQIHDQQMFSFKTGATIMGVSDNAIGTSNLEVVVPSLITNLKIEAVNVDSIDFGNDLTMIDINPDCADTTHGLTKILKKSTVTAILNMIQTEEPAKEYMFYADLINKMKDSHTYNRSLLDMRLMMQYALNCDTLLLQTVMTELVVVPKED